MKNKNLAIDMLFFCYAFFSFSVYEPIGKMNIYSWFMLLTLNSMIYIFITLFLGDNYRLKPLCQFAILIYIFYLIGAQTIKMWKYINLYHSRTSVFSTIIVTAVVILLLINTDSDRITDLYLPISFMLFLLIIAVFFLNISKVSRYNLNYSDKELFMNNYITLFDYIIPYNLIKKQGNKKTRESSFLFIIKSNLILFSLVIYAFLCVKGDLLYRLSPLQMLFRISATNYVRNFDAMFNFLLYFAYFGTLTALILAYKSVKKQFSYFSKYDILLVIPMMYLFILFNVPILFIELLMMILILLGREKKNIYEKNND